MNILLWILIFQWAQGQEVDPRCLDPPASEAAKVETQRCKSISGYSWHPSTKDCVLEPYAGCADTKNKFKHQQLCLQCNLHIAKVIS